MNEEFEEFFQYLEKKLPNSSEKEIKNILKPLKYFMWKQQLKRNLKIALIFISICLAIYYNDTLNWYFCAITRILMIKILPLWNWRYLGRSKCLIEKAQTQSSTTTSYINNNNNNDKIYEGDVFNVKDCRACEHFEQIDVMKKVKYSDIHDKYLIRGLPIIISDSIKTSNQSESLLSIIDNISANMSDMLNSEACNFETNLMMSKYANLDKTFTILRKLLESENDENEAVPWFISFRNCKLKALKASRLLMSKPYFYPINLQAPYTTWILMSQNYENYQNDLEVFGMVIVTQMKGSIKVSLKAKRNCQTFCKDLSVKLFTGESLVFFSNLWIFSYEYLTDDKYSITFITETNLY